MSHISSGLFPQFYSGATTFQNCRFYRIHRMAKAQTLSIAAEISSPYIILLFYYIFASAVSFMNACHVDLHIQSNATSSQERSNMDRKNAFYTYNEKGQKSHNAERTPPASANFF